MKKLLLGSMALLLATGVMAQETMTGSMGRIGIKAGVNLSRMHYSGFTAANTLNDFTKNRVGYSLTVFGDFGVGNNFFVQPGVSLQNKGTKLEGSVPSGTTTATGTANIDIMAIEVPVNAVIRIPTAGGAFQISAGPYVSFNIDGTSTTNVTSGPGSGSGATETDLKFGKDASDNLASTEFGANFGLGYRLNNGINIGANYGLGLTNLVPEANRSGGNKAVNRILGFTVGYSF